ncbi:MAG TPA: TonB-dependent receptor [Verrucomicrobiae bacterium]|nr:TonB-dependent receptor [Verrucomicrobiae bacterium]
MRAPAFWLACLLIFAPRARADDSTNAPADGSKPPVDLTDLDLTTLMNIPIVTASKFEQKAAEAPASTTVITSEDIKRYGYRTLGDALSSVPGFYVSYDRNYQFLGARGVNLGDYNSRILLLVNGHRINSDLTDGAFIDTAFILDLDLIDRIEIVRGPGSVLYGDNAFFGVINVITRHASQINGAEVSGSYGEFNTYQTRVSVGKVFTNGMELLLSGSISGSDGPENLFYPEYNTASQNNGVAHNLDDDAFRSAFGSLHYKDFTLQGAFNEREKGNPTAQFGTTFNDSRLQTTDERGYANLSFEHSFPDVVDLKAQVYYDRTSFEITYPDVPLVFREQQQGDWWGTEVQLTKKLLDRHVITVGAEYRDDFNQHRRLFEADTGDVSANVNRTRINYGIYAQGDFAVVTNLHVNTGVRYDQYGDFKPSVDPRLALIYNPFPASTIKALYGRAFRAPNFLELSDPFFPNLGPEKITSYELVFEQDLGKSLKASVSGFYNQMDNLIFLQNGSFTNFDADANGMELSLEGAWPNGIRTRASYTFEDTRNSGTREDLTDSPNHLGKFDISVPLYQQKVFAGLEFQYVSARDSQHVSPVTGLDVPGRVAGGYGVVNFTLFSQNLVKNLEFSGSVYNLLDTHYSDPATRFHHQDLIPQDGRTFRLKLTYRF